MKQQLIGEGTEEGHNASPHSTTSRAQWKLRRKLPELASVFYSSALHRNLHPAPDPSPLGQVLEVLTLAPPPPGAKDSNFNGSSQRTAQAALAMSGPARPLSAISPASGGGCAILPQNLKTVAGARQDTDARTNTCLSASPSWLALSLPSHETLVEPWMNQAAGGHQEKSHSIKQGTFSCHSHIVVSFISTTPQAPLCRARVPKKSHPACDSAPRRGPISFELTDMPLNPFRQRHQSLASLPSTKRIVIACAHQGHGSYLEPEVCLPQETELGNIIFISKSPNRVIHLLV